MTTVVEHEVLSHRTQKSQFFEVFTDLSEKSRIFFAEPREIAFLMFNEVTLLEGKHQ